MMRLLQRSWRKYCTLRLFWRCMTMGILTVLLMQWLTVFLPQSFFFKQYTSQMPFFSVVTHLVAATQVVQHQNRRDIERNEALPFSPKNRDESEDDEEEFEYRDPSATSPVEQPAVWQNTARKSGGSSINSSTRVEEELWFSRNATKAMLFESFWVDCVAAFILIIVLVTVYVGKRQNHSLAESWIMCSFPLFEKQFSKLYFSNSDLNFKSWHSCELYASGRKNCLYMSVELELMKLQCLWRGFLLNKISKQESIVRITFFTDSLDTIIFGICRKREQKQFLSEQFVLRTLCRPRDRKDFPSNLLCCSEISESISILFKSHIVKMLWQIEPYFKSLVVSDISTTGEKNLKKTGYIRLEFLLPTEEKIKDDALPLIYFSLWILDVAADLKLSDKVRDSLLKQRMIPTEDEKRENEEIRNEALEKRRQERKREEEKRLENATPEQRRKLEEKKYKKQAKAGSMRFKILKA